MPLLRPSNADFLTFVKAAVSSPAGGAVKSAASVGAQPILGRGALVRASYVGTKSSPASSVLQLFGPLPAAGPPPVLDVWAGKLGAVSTLVSSELSVNSVAVLPNGNIVASLPSFDSKIRLITMPSVAVSTLAGDSNQFADGALGVARFNDPRGLAVFPNGDIVVADSANHRIRLIASGVVSTLAGDGTTTILSAPRGVAVLSNGNIVVAGVSTNKIHLITMPGGVVSTLAGDGSTSIFHTPSGIAVLPNGNIVVSELNGNRIRLITMPGGVVSTLAGTSGAGAFVEGQGTLARFNSPRGLAVLPNGNIVVADGGNNRIRLITMPDGVVSTLAGDTATGTTNATGSGARFSGPSGVAVFPNGNIVVADTGNSLIRLIVPA